MVLSASVVPPGTAEKNDQAQEFYRKKIAIFLSDYYNKKGRWHIHIDKNLLKILLIRKGVNTMEGRSHRVDSDNSHPDPGAALALTRFIVGAAYF